MKPYQITGEISRHLRNIFSAKLKPYPSIGSGSIAKIFFLYPKGQLAASGYLRAQQLFDITSSIFDAYITDDLAKISDNSLVIATKGTLELAISAGRQGPSKNIRVYYDPIDQLLDLPKLKKLDGLVASSYRQYLWLRSITDKPVFLLPHHADQRISVIVEEHLEFGIAYFGLTKNCFLPAPIAQQIKVFETRDYQATEWMQNLANYPLHFCIRRKPEKSHSYKPATKLFIAAKVGAAVITTRDESDAELLLPPDYPFYCHSRTARSVGEMIEFAKASYGTSIFEKAVKDVKAIKGWREEEQITQIKLMLDLI
jgi:hypothetical protein